MIAAILLPSVHVLDHDPMQEELAYEVNIDKNNIDCQLCDFHFSSTDAPQLFEYNLHLPVIEIVYNVSIFETVYPYPLSLFSLRAPPADFA